MALREGSVGGKYTDAKWYEYWRKTDTELKIIMRLKIKELKHWVIILNIQPKIVLVKKINLRIILLIIKTIILF